MATNDDPLHEHLERVWRTPPGLRALTGVNHSSVGLRFIVTGFAWFLFAGVLAMLLRSQLSFAGNDLLDAPAYAAAFTMHGTAMMFFFAVPIMEGVAMYLIPKMIGARDLAFPRLSAFGYWCYLFGGLLLLAGMVVGSPPDGGWFMYVPLSGKVFSPGMGPDFWLLGVTFAEISAVAGAVELVVSILKMRAPGMTLARMPMFAWYILVTAFMIIYAFPPLILGGILLELERAFGMPFYAVEAGGDPLLWQHLFWLFGHPEVYIIFLPAAGVVSTIVPTFARRPIAGYPWLVAAVVAMGFVSFGLWVHHMFATGIPLVALAFFSAASMAVAVPSGIQVFAWIATLWNGRPTMGTPLLFLMGFLFIFVLGGLTGVMVALVPFDWQVHDTHFVVAHLHYVLIGGMVFPLFAALYYWLPLLSGREVAAAPSRLVFWLIFGGFNVAFLPMHLTGLVGMPRRVYTYAPGLGWDFLNLVSTLGGFLMAAGVGMFLIDFWAHYTHGRRTTRNPWGAGTLEWAMRAPVPSYNFASLPVVDDRDPLWRDPELAGRIRAGAFLLADPAAKCRETLFTGAVDARPEQVIILPGNTWAPLVAALFVAVFFTGFLVKHYSLSAAGAGLAVVALLAWAWRTDRHPGGAALDVGGGLMLPFHYTTERGPGWWGTLIAIQADAVLYASLLFAWFFLWTFAPSWPPAGHAAMGLVGPTLALGALVASGLAAWLARRAVRANAKPRTRLWLGVALVLAAAYTFFQVIALVHAPVGAREHAFGALVHTIHGFVIVHVAIAMLMGGFVLARSFRGHVGAHAPLEMAVATLFWQYVIVQACLAWLVVHVFPLVAGRP